MRFFNAGKNGNYDGITWNSDCAMKQAAEISDDAAFAHRRQCSKCVLIADARRHAIFYTLEQKRQAYFRPIFISFVIMSGWPDHRPLYLCCCARCGHIFSAMPEAKKGDSRLYFVCSYCRARHLIKDFRIYRKAGLTKTKPIWPQWLAMILKDKYLQEYAYGVLFMTLGILAVVAVIILTAHIIERFKF